MPVAFSDQEREHITTTLKAAGRRLFAGTGLRKTSIADLVAEAGIVKSTFYNFFDSKEALYLELLLEQAARTREMTINQGLHAASDTRDALRRFLRGAVQVLDQDPLYRRLVSHPEEIAAITRKLTPAAVAKAGDNGMAELSEFVAGRQAADELPGTDPAVVVGVMRVVLLLPLHAHEFGESYPQVLDLAIDAVTAGLTGDH